jgi:hypothetical protein
MAEVSYVPGDRTAIAGDGCWVLIDASPDSAVVAEIWRRIAAPGASLDGLIAGVMQFGLAHVPDFVLLVADTDGRRHLICRGSGSAAVEEPDGRTQRVSGAGLGTWLDYPMPAGVRCVAIGEPATERSLLLPASAGIFLASSVIVDLTATGHHSRPMPIAPAPAVAAPAPGPVPVPGPALAWAPAADPLPQQPVTVQAMPAQAMGAPAGPEGNEPDGDGYDFLFEATQMRSVEDAAIRSDHGGEPLFSFPGGATSFPGPEPPAQRWSAAPEGGLPEQASGIGTSGIGKGGMIESVPWASAPQPGLPGGPAPASLDPGSTLPPRALMSTITIPPPFLPGTGPGATAAGGGLAGGGAATPEPAGAENTETIRRGSLPAPMPVAALADRIGPTVQALLCPSGHVSPPNCITCRACAEPLPQQEPVLVPRPALGVLRLSTGDVITLDRSVVMGRNPRSELAGDERPHVVKLPSGDGEISRTHLIVTLDGWHVLVTDLQSTNGTLVELPGRLPERLRPKEAMPIPNGALVTLADGIYFRFEVTR